ncbi:hypothetical protein MKW92_032535 [Papaver armeniacum]|nr:hypothetical protein MKW92_032535 [Papaver armeniacum]
MCRRKNPKELLSLTSLRIGPRPAYSGLVWICRKGVLLCVCRGSIAVDPAEQRFRPDCRKWVRRFCISMRISRAPTTPSSKS